MPAQREWFETDYYKVLGVAPEATEKEITRAAWPQARVSSSTLTLNPGSEDRFKGDQRRA